MTVHFNPESNNNYEVRKTARGKSHNLSQPDVMPQKAKKNNPAENLPAAKAFGLEHSKESKKDVKIPENILTSCLDEKGNIDMEKVFNLMNEGAISHKLFSELARLSLEQIPPESYDSDE